MPAPASTPVTGPGGTAPIAMPPPTGAACEHGSERWIEMIAANHYKFHFYDCQTTPRNQLRRYFYMNQPFVDVCLPPGVPVYAGWHDTSSPYGFPFDGELIQTMQLTPECTPPRGPEPPIVTVDGRVLTEVNFGGPTRSLAGAYAELWYKGRAGSVDDPVEWRPVLSGVDENGAPAGAPARTALDGDGRYSLRFPYPHEHRLRNGATWHGCEAPAVRVPFLTSFACDPPGTPGDEPPAAEESALQLRVYARTEDHNITVIDIETADVALATTVHLGLFFERDEEEKTVTAKTPGAFALGGALTVREFWPREFEDVSVHLNDLGQTHYEPSTSTIMLARSDVGTSYVEHEAAHHVHDRLPFRPPTAPDCEEHHKMVESNPACAWQEGLADFIALAAEHRFTRRAILEGNGPDRFHMELCVWLDESYQIVDECDEGDATGGRVTSMLWDLYDVSDELFPDGVEVYNGFEDATSMSFDADILPTLEASGALTFKEFYAQWPHRERNRQIAFLNTLTMRDAVSDSDGRSEGAWSSVPCGACHEKSYSRSAPDERARMTWSFPDVPEAGKYQLWVRLPKGDAELEDAALYTVTTADGPETVVVDQSRAADGWLNLRASGFEFAPGAEPVVTLSSAASPGKALVADAVILADVVP